MPEPPVIDAEPVEEPGELVAVEPKTTLFRTDDPIKVVERASQAADALKTVLTKQKLTTSIQGREHVNVEGWLTLGAMLGVTPVCAWTRPLEDGWEARVEARTLDGRVIGAAEAECLRSESSWKSRDDYALRSMAQTRATSKALGSVLRFVVTLAGYEGTPAEEMPREQARPTAATNDAPRVTDKQAGYIASLVEQAAGLSKTDSGAVRSWSLNNLSGGRDGEASRLIGALNDDAKRDEALEWVLGKALLPESDIPADSEGLPRG